MHDIDDLRAWPILSRRLVPTLAGGAYLALVVVIGWLGFVRFRPAFLPVSDAVVDPWWAGWIVVATIGGWGLQRGLRHAASAPVALEESARLPEMLAPRVEMLPEPSAAWRRVGMGMLDARAFDPDTLDHAQDAALDHAACVARLHEREAAWHRAHGERDARTARLLWLDLVLVLLDRGVIRALHDGRLPDTAALRTERLLLGADGGPAVLAEVPALLARRIALALDRLPDAQRAVADAHWQLLQTLRPLLEQERQLERRSQLVLALAWNADVDLDQVEVAYALADEYRQQVYEWLQRAAVVAVPGRGRLAGWLLAGCDVEANAADDAIGHVEALRPLHAALSTLLQDTLAALVDLADLGERTAAPVMVERPVSGQASQA